MNRPEKNPSRPEFAHCLLKIFYPDDEAYYTSLGDFKEVYFSIKNSKGILIARMWYWMQLLLLLKSLLTGTISWSLIMFKSYIKTALRNIRKQKVYSIINLTGFSIGLACCILIFLYVKHELSYDNFHQKADRIYRIERNIDYQHLTGRWPITSGGYGPALAGEYPEIENFARLWRRELNIKDYKNVSHKQQLIAADNSIFKIFDFNMESGNKNTALSQPYTAVLTRGNAIKYFGTDDVIGKTLAFELDGKTVDFQITGIMEKVPENSHVHFDMLMSITTTPEEQLNKFQNNYIYTYVLLSGEASVSVLEEKFKSFLTKYVYTRKKFLGKDVEDAIKMQLRPVQEIHLDPCPHWEIEPQGSQTSVFIFSSIAVLILVIACINFMNLSSARAFKRAKEVGLRKTVGACKHQLWNQFVGESMLLAVISLFFAILLVFISIPVFNSIFGEILSKNLLLKPQNLSILVGITILSGLTAGIYPAYKLALFEPAQVLKGGTFSGTGKSTFRKCMVILQFVISITLIIGTLTIVKQLEYIQNRPLGFDKENVVIIPADSKQLRQKLDTFRSLLIRDSRIKSVSASSHTPGNKLFSDRGFRRIDTNETFNLINIITDFDFVDTYGISIVKGRTFSRDFGTDKNGSFILNEAAVKRINCSIEDVIGKRLSFSRNQISGSIIGVMKDFHFKSLHREIEPLVLILSPESFSNISVRMSAGDQKETIGFIRQKWAEIFPNEQFVFSFLDTRINQLYKSEEKMKHIFIIFAALSILIACLGLFGLSTFIAEERTKEIGVRKVLGASTYGIVLLLSKEFTRLVILANIAAWPLTWYLMNKWLQNFAYSINIGWLTFILSGIIALAIALLTVIYQAIRAATANPVESLKYE